ncbi:MAG: DUF2169 domain-containing protein [Rhodocyclaceae bacterium]|nr:DUF2169 domain-containing protein [Rhodocyclaceae bacterium]MBX3668280.1 DUF2169 domain-containing protein [Rhodocyclaceae bacterium]
MKAIKPQALGLLSKPYRFRGQDRLVIVALGFFRLGEPVRNFLPEQAGWPEILPRLPAEQPLDAVMPKRRAEVLAAATAYSAQPVSSMQVRLQVGVVDKRLKVIGERAWRYGTVPLHTVSAPLPFQSMPLSYERAYGGPAHAGNPVGCGHTGRLTRGLTGPVEGAMPNVEYPNEPVRGHYRALPPAGFAPLDLRWAPRSRMGGTYDRRWLEQVSPGLPEDLDWAMFNVAPEDQQVPGFFTGGETYRLEGLHPERPVIEGRLPDFRLRALVETEAHAPQEVALAFDTLWLFPDAELGLALYRGESAVADPEAEDVKSILLAYEHRRDAPRATAHYVAALAARSGSGRDALVHLLNEAPLRPAPDAAERARLAQEAEAERQASRARDAALEAAAAADLDGHLPDAKPASVPDFAAAAAAQAAPYVCRAQLARGEADLAPLFAHIDARVAEAREQAEVSLAALADDAAASAAQPSAAEDTQTALDRLAGRHHAEYAELLATAASTGAAAGQGAAPATPAAADLAALDLAGRRAAAKPVAPPLAPAAATALGAEVLRLLRAGATLAGRDMAGANLAGARLAGADLKNALLENADLSRADLSRADLSGAVLCGARLDGAKLDGARLDGASLNAARAAGASFRGVRADRLSSLHAELAGSDWQTARVADWVALGADLQGANFAAAELPRAVFLQAQAATSRWQGARLGRDLFVRADLREADFSGAKLQQTVFADCNAPRAAFAGAELESCFLGSARLAGSDWQGARARQTSWRGAQLAGAKLAGGRFEACDFGRADLAASDLGGARFKSSILSRAHLESSQARDSDWFQSQCRGTDFRRADLAGGRFMQADLSNAKLAGAALDGARHLPADAPSRSREKDKS